MNPVVLYVFVLAYALVAAALVLVMGLRRRARGRLGPELASHLPGGLLRWGGIALLAGAALVVLAAREVDPALALPLLVLASLLQLLRPSFGDRVCHEGGVRSGWKLEPWAELGAACLSGRRLRFRVDAEWTALELSPASREHVRRQLEGTVRNQDHPPPARPGGGG